MQVINKRVLYDCIRRHPRSEKKMLDWYLEVNGSKWSSERAMKSLSSIIVESTEEDGLYLFKVSSTFMITAMIVFKARTVYIQFAGTQKEYDDEHSGELS